MNRSLFFRARFLIVVLSFGTLIFGQLAGAIWFQDASAATAATTDLRLISLTAAPQKANTGGQIEYNATIGNFGAVPVTNTTFLAYFPANVSFQSIVPVPPVGLNCSYLAGDILSCKLPSMGPNGTVSFGFVGKVADDAPVGRVTLTATVSDAQVSDSDPSNNTAEVSTTIYDQADVEVVNPLGISSGTVVAGTALTVTAIIENEGPSRARNVVAAIELPDDVELDRASLVDSLTGEPVLCGGLSCQLGNLSQGERVTVTVVATVKASHAPSANEVVRVAAFSDTYDADLNDNERQVTFDVTTAGDVGVALSDLSDPVAVGGSLVYEAVVSNGGPSDSRGWTARLTLDGKVTATGASPGCVLNSPGVGQVSCALGTIAAGGEKRYQVAVTVGDVVSGTVLASSVTLVQGSGTAEPAGSTGNNSATATTVAQAMADVRLVKRATATAAAGEAITYTLTASNAGPASASGVTIVDPLPAGVTVANAGGCTPTGNELTCAVGALAVGATKTFTVVVTAGSDLAVGTSVVNTAEVTASVVDPDVGNNAGQATTTIVGRAALSLSKTGPASATAGELLTYTLVVSNSGPSAAEQVLVVDELPAGLALVSASSSLGTCSGGSCLVGRLPVNGQAVVTVTARAAASLAAGSVVTNTAQVSGLTVDADLSDNTAAAATVIETAADLSVSVVDLSDPVAPLAGFLYEITVVNSGPSDAVGVVISDTLDGNTTYAAASAGCVSPAAGEVVCGLERLAAGASARFLLAVTVADVSAGTVLTNAVVVGAATADPVAANNQGTATTTVAQDLGPSADLGVSKAADRASVKAGETLTYTVTISNSGPSVATNVQLLEMLPPGLTLLSASAENIFSDMEFCTLSGICYIGLMYPGGTASVTLVAAVDPGTAAGTALNRVSVSADQQDKNAGNNLAGAAVDVTTAAVLGITATDLVDPVVAGEILPFQLKVLNFGPSDAAGVVVTTTVPALTELTGMSDFCAETGGVITCTIGLIEKGAAATAVVELRVSQAILSGTVVSLQAFASAANAAGVDDQAATTVVQSPLNPTDLAIAKTAALGTAVAGETLTYTVTITNNGPAPASGVQMVDFLPAKTRVIQVTPDAGSCNAALTCLLGDLAVGAVVDIEIVLGLDSDLAGPMTNTARVLASNPDTVPANNLASAGTQTTAEAAVSIAKSAAVTEVVAGGQMAYEIVVRNAGPSDAQGVIVTDTLPAELVDILLTAAQGSCAAGVCQLGTLPAGATARIQVSGRVTAAAQAPFTNTATVATATFNRSLDTTDSAPVTVVPGADLALVKLATPTAIAGGQITYTLVVYQQGASDAQNVVVTDPLPAGVTLSQADPGCQLKGGTVTCALGTLSPGTIVSRTVVVDVASGLEKGSSIENTAAVSSDTADGNALNDSDTADTSIIGSADLSLTWSGPVVAYFDRVVVYRATVTNRGSSSADSVRLQALFPRPVLLGREVMTAVVTRTGSGPAGCVDTICQFGDIAAGETVEVAFTVRTETIKTARWIDDFTVTGVIFSDTPDPTMGDHEADFTSITSYRRLIPFIIR